MPKREKLFGGGWSKWIDSDGRRLFLIVKRGRFTRRAWGNRCFEWHGQVIESGKVLWSGRVDKEVSQAALLECVDVK